jgi:hypothetical protein
VLKRLILALTLLALASQAWAQARGNIFSTRAQKEFEAALTLGGLFGVPRTPTASLPACTTSQMGAVRFDTTAAGLTVCDGSSWAAVGGGGGGGANTSLSNLTSTSINTALFPATAGAWDLGSTTKSWRELWISGPSGTETNNFQITGTSTSGTRVITLPDASGTVLLTGGSASFSTVTTTHITATELAAFGAGEITFSNGGFYNDGVSTFVMYADGGLQLDPGSGHVKITGTAPAVSACGTSPSLAIGSDHAGKVTAGTAAPTSCLLTFAVVWTTAPACVCNDETAIVACQAVSTTTTLTLNTAASMDSHVLSYICMQGS